MKTDPLPAYSDFVQAAEDWDLVSLMDDLKSVHQRKLTDREQKILRGLLCDYSPEEIARLGYGNSNSRPIASDISRIYDYIELLVEVRTHEPQKITSQNVLRRVLKEIGYRKTQHTSQ
jgi:hypothetical protein